MTRCLDRCRWRHAGRRRRAQTRLDGGPGSDTIYGPDDDTLLAGGPGDDTYVVEVGDPVTVTETMGEGMDTLRYAVLADDPDDR